MATATSNDMQLLASDPTFGNRVQELLEQYCWNVVPGETGLAVYVHAARKTYASQILGNPNFYKPMFVLVVASNQTVANDATAAGTLVGLTAAQIATQALSCTDTDINNAIAAAFNAFIAGI